MKAAIALDYGKIDDMVVVKGDWPEPHFEPEDMKGSLLVKVMAASVAPGDLRVLSGRTRAFQGPKEMPCILGGDVCGLVQKVGQGEQLFKPGDVVICRFDEKPLGAFAEYAIMKSNVAMIKPSNIDVEKGAAIGSSGLPALVLAKHIKKGDRVLVLGASGGVGTFLVQLAKIYGASYVAGTSTQTELLTSLGVDRVIDYTKQSVWEVDEFKTQKFDVVIDLVEHGWKHAKLKTILKSGFKGGRFLTTVPPIGRQFDIGSYFQLCTTFLFPIFGRSIWTFFNRFSPRYKFVLGLTSNRKLMDEFCDLVKTEKLKVVVDPRSPFPFTTDGVRGAFRAHEEFHAHGKLVIRISNDL
mmetsp:Transcript_8689/g.14081  ORF Transcript_8689/g.14081 Transcript_8689/m.14081 type:complete len:353 (-) Transcript_8689:82-1140(-)